MFLATLEKKKSLLPGYHGREAFTCSSSTYCSINCWNLLLCISWILISEQHRITLWDLTGCIYFLKYLKSRWMLWFATAALLLRSTAAVQFSWSFKSILQCYWRKHSMTVYFCPAFLHYIPTKNRKHLKEHSLKNI